jgi:twitching motility protein PilT
MSVLASLIAALERAGGERLVLRSGETPHVLAGGTRHDLGTTKVSVKALEALTEQLLSPEARREFAANNVAVEPLSDAISPVPLVVGTHRSGDQMRIELRRIRPATGPAAPQASAASPNASAVAQAITAAASEGAAFVEASASAPASADKSVPTATPRSVPPKPPAAAAPPTVDPVVVTPPPIRTPPAPDDPDWEPIEVPAAAATSAPAQPPATPAPPAAVILSAGGVPVAEVPAEAAPVASSMPTEPELFPTEADTIVIPRPSWLLKEPATKSVRPEAGPAPIAAGPISITDIDETDDESDPEEVRVASGPMKIVPMAAAEPIAARLADADDRSDASALEYWVRQAARREATALYLRAGHAPVVRARQRVQPLADEPLGGSVIEAVTAALAAGEDDWLAVSRGEWAREFDGVGPVRCQAFTDDRGSGLVVHLLSQTSASSLQKDIPRQVRRICEKGDGIVVVAASAPADVMHMVAAVAEVTAQRRAGYVISIEPPNGLGHNITGILVSARRIGGTEQDVAAAIRRAVHEGPDVLVVAVASGLIAEEAIRAATPGCLVIVGAMAPTAPQALEALLSRVNRDSEPDLRRSFAAAFRCGFGYRTLRGSGGERAIVHDVVMGTPEVRAQLESRDVGGLERLQRSGAGGMRSLDAALAGAVHRGEISLRQAAGFAIDRREVVRLVRQAARERNRAARERQGDRSPGALRAVSRGIASA